MTTSFDSITSLFTDEAGEAFFAACASGPNVNLARARTLGRFVENDPDFRRTGVATLEIVARQIDRLMPSIPSRHAMSSAPRAY